MGHRKQSSSKVIESNQKNISRKFDSLKVDKEFLPIKINCGNLGTIFSKHNDFNKAQQQVFNIYDTIMEVFSRSIKEKRSTLDIAEAIAMTRLR